MAALAAVDTVGYVRFASVYRNFSEASDFETFIQQLRPSEHSDDEGDAP
jgi:transcriptional repressor NrdR